jgi:anti-sigma regulatory factor (Ser/Thr protein kinase)
MAAAQSLGFSEGRRSDVGIVATEAATNILLHAGSGEILVCPIHDQSTVGLDLLALDNGPGIVDVSKAFDDGFSTGGTAGQGLGAIRRIADACSMYSLAQKGTVLWIRILETAPADVSHGVVNIPMKGESVCGDSFLALPGLSRSLYMVVDGLGHGAYAAEAAAEAVATVGACAGESPTEIVTRAHDALKKTRGAAMSVAVVDHQRKIVTYSGIGNISALIVNATANRNMISQNGTLGAVLPRVQEYTYPIDDRSLLLMYSDGISTRCSLAGYPGLQSRPLGLVAGVLYRDFSRRRDDATVLLASIGGDAA